MDEWTATGEVAQGTDARSVLFVCVENSNRSQMAQAFAEIHGAGVLTAESAGSRPAAQVNPRAVAAMRRAGHDISGHRPKGLGEVSDRRWDYVITMGCGDECPFLAAGHREDWDLPDPRDMPDVQYDAVRDEVERRVVDLVRRIRDGTA